MLSDVVGQHFVVEAQHDLFGLLRLSGDDVTDFFEDYAARFDVDMSDFLWYFHYNADEPPHLRRVLPVLTDGQVAPYRPITLAQLVKAVEAGRWINAYPAHYLRKRRWQMFAPILACIGIGLLIGFLL